MLVSRPMVASPRAYRSDRWTGQKGSIDADHRGKHRQGDGRCRRSEEPLRPHLLPYAWQEVIEGVTRNGQNPGRCRGSVSGVWPGLVVPCPALPGQAELPRAKPRHALPRRGGRLAPKGAAPPLRALMVRRPLGSAEGPSDHASATPPANRHGDRDAGDVSIGGQAGLDVEWESEEEDDGTATEERIRCKPFTARRARQVQPESDLEPPEDPERSLPDPEEGAPSSRLR